jgi:hypothetical protein
MTTTVLRLAWLLTICVCAAAQDQKPVFEEVGYLGLFHSLASWTSPESVARDLRSPDDTVRLKALYLLGLPDKNTRQPIYATTQDGSTKLIGQKVVSPDQIDLRYAALGSDSTQQAILAVQVSQMMYAAVAIPRAQGWERVALFDCWCKYDMANALGEFLEIRSAPGGTQGRSELVLRSSGGGTGIYTQDEAHYRLYDGTLRRVMSFVSRKKSCPPTDPPPKRCSVEYRWFYGVGSGAVLLEATGGFPVDNVPPAAFSLPDFQSRYATSLTCKQYVWNEKEFRYDRASRQTPCNPWQTQ